MNNQYEFKVGKTYKDGQGRDVDIVGELKDNNGQIRLVGIIRRESYDVVARYDRYINPDQPPSSCDLIPNTKTVYVNIYRSPRGYLNAVAYNDAETAAAAKAVLEREEGDILGYDVLREAVPIEIQDED